ncbi:MAG: hypothetical protein R3190_00520 [Thermoanaerobaculia bacterium]|nr:hypothetical protein [Thermoanaerobaculia bacterium]
MIAIRCPYVVLIAAALLAVGPAAAKPPFEYSCPGDEIHVSWCCPESAVEAFDSAYLVVGLVCTEGGFEFYELLDEEESVEQAKVRGAGGTATAFANLITAEVKVRLHRYQEQNVRRCRDLLDKAEDNKKLGKARKKIEKDLAARRAAGECALTPADLD